MNPDSSDFQWFIHSSFIPSPTVEQLRYELTMLRIPHAKSSRRDALIEKLPLTHVWRGYSGVGEIDTRIPLYLWTRTWTTALIKHQLDIAGIPYKSKSRHWDLLPQTHPWKQEVADRLTLTWEQIQRDQNL